MDLERRSSKPEVASSSLAGAATRFGVVQPAGRLTLNQETKVRILSPKPILLQFSGRSADDYTDLPWEQVFAGLNPAAQTNFSI